MSDVYPRIRLTTEHGPGEQSLVARATLTDERKAFVPARTRRSASRPPTQPPAAMRLPSTGVRAVHRSGRPAPPVRRGPPALPAPSTTRLRTGVVAGDTSRTAATPADPDEESECGRSRPRRPPWKTSTPVYAPTAALTTPTTQRPGPLAAGKRSGRRQGRAHGRREAVRSPAPRNTRNVLRPAVGHRTTRSYARLRRCDPFRPERVTRHDDLTLLGLADGPSDADGFLVACPCIGDRRTAAHAPRRRAGAVGNALFGRPYLRGRNAVAASAVRSPPPGRKCS